MSKVVYFGVFTSDTATVIRKAHQCASIWDFKKRKRKKAFCLVFSKVYNIFGKVLLVFLKNKCLVF